MIVAHWMALALAVAPVVVTVKDAKDDNLRTFRGVPLSALVPKGDGDAVLVRCADGFVALIPLAVVQRATPVLADAVLRGSQWGPIEAPQGPRYLVWPNADPKITGEEWAWGVSEIALVRSAEYLAPLSAGPARGRTLWMQSCFHCHAIGGAGGLAGWDFADPIPLWRYRDEKQIAAYLKAPRQQNPDGRMPAIPLNDADQAELWAFLHAALPAP